MGGHGEPEPAPLAEPAAHGADAGDRGVVACVALAELGDGCLDGDAACEVVFGFATEPRPGVGAGSCAFEAGAGGVDGVEVGVECAGAGAREAAVRAPAA